MFFLNEYHAIVKKMIQSIENIMDYTIMNSLALWETVSQYITNDLFIKIK